MGSASGSSNSTMPTSPISGISTTINIRPSIGYIVKKRNSKSKASGKRKAIDSESFTYANSQDVPPQSGQSQQGQVCLGRARSGYISPDAATESDIKSLSCLIKQK